MLTLLDVLTSWFAGWQAAGSDKAKIEFVRGDTERSKRSAWLIVEGSAVSGQVTIWDTGECDIEAYRNEDSSAVLQRSKQIESVDEILAEIGELLEACTAE